MRVVVVSVVLVALGLVEVCVCTAEVDVDVVVLFVEELVVSLEDVVLAATVCVWVTVTVLVVVDPQAASNAAVTSARAAEAGLSGSFVTRVATVPVRNPARQRLSSARTGARAMACRAAPDTDGAALHIVAGPTEGNPLAVVTISSAYGALGSEVGRAVAAARDLPFLDRAIPAAVAEKLAVPLEEAEGRDEALAGFFERLLSSFVVMGSVYGSAVPPIEVPDEESFRVATEQTILDLARSGAAVILGRAGMLVLAGHPHVLRVRLSGPLEARIAQAAARYGFTLEEARRQERENDGARAAWVRRLYGRDVADPALYDLVINATRFGVEECVALIVAASAAV